MYIFAILVMIPSVFMAINLVRESSFNSQAIKFVHDIQQTSYFDKLQLIDAQNDYNKKEQTITLRKPLAMEDIARMQMVMRKEYGLDRAKLVVKQTDGALDITQQTQLIEDIIDKKDAVINSQDSTIVALQAQLDKLTGSSENTKQVVKEIKSQYADIQQVAIVEMQCYDADSLTAVPMPVVYLKWNDGRIHPEAERRLLQWLKVRLNVEDIQIMRIN